MKDERKPGTRRSLLPSHECKSCDKAIINIFENNHHLKLNFNFKLKDYVFCFPKSLRWRIEYKCIKSGLFSADNRCSVVLLSQSRPFFTWLVTDKRIFCLSLKIQLTIQFKTLSQSILYLWHDSQSNKAATLNHNPLFDLTLYCKHWCLYICMLSRTCWPEGIDLSHRSNTKQWNYVLRSTGNNIAEEKIKLQLLFYTDNHGMGRHG